MKSKKSLLNMIFCLIIISPLQNSMAQSHDRIPSEDGVLSAGPYYNPSSKSYFELRRKNNITWDQAALAVKMLKYKNISGRLATIANPSTHSFLVKKFTF